MCSLNKSTHSNLSDYPLGTQLHYFPLPLLQWTAINAMVPEGPVSQKWTLSPRKIFFLFFLNFILLFNFTILYWFCHISTWILHRYTRVPHPEPSSLLPPHTIPLSRLSASAPSIQYHASNLDWRFISYMILYMFQCHSPKSSHPLPLQQSPKACSIHLCLLCCLTYRVIVTIFLNSIYMRLYTVLEFFFLASFTLYNGL